MGHHDEILREIEQLEEEFLIVMTEQASQGIRNLDTEEAGAVIDMIKDLAEARRNCEEACYYETAVKAMTDSSNSSHSYIHGTTDTMQNAMTTLRTLWHDADPTSKAQMVKDLTALLAELKV